MTSNASRLADFLVDAHRSGEPVEAPPVPADLDEAMECQAMVAAGLGHAVVGWKVALAPAGPVAAPVFGALSFESPARWTWRPGLAVEVEIAAVLCGPLPGSAPSRVAVEAAVGAFRIGVELVRPRLAAGSAAPFPAFLADNLGNAGYVAGTRIDAWRGFALDGRRCRIRLDGRLLHDGPARHPQGDILAPLAAYAARPSDRLGGLRVGQLVTTGSLCGLVPVTGPGHLEAEVEGAGSVTIVFAGT
jgi:2-keto-4-pentenoate hydratase